MNRNDINIKLLCIALTCAGWPTLGNALSSDSSHPMLIEADSAELDDAKGVSIYKGKVKVTQGTLVLTGEIMTIFNENGEINKVIIEGTPATYKQRPDGKDQDVNASAINMEYFRVPERIVLTQKAIVEQDGDVLKSERITYDVAKDLVSAGGNKPNDRVTITLQPSGNRKSSP